MLFNELNDGNFRLFAIKNYENPQAVTEADFDKDLNHFIILYNIFGEATTPMLFHKIEEDLWPVMKTFVMFLGKFPEYPHTKLHDIQPDLNCLRELYKIYNKDGKE